MHGKGISRRRRLRSFAAVGTVAVAAVAVASVGATAGTHSGSKAFKLNPKFSKPVAFDKSQPLRDLVRNAAPGTIRTGGPAGADRKLSIDRGSGSDSDSFSFASLFRPLSAANSTSTATPAPILTFEGLSNQDNFNVFGGRVNPPDPVGEVGPNNYVEMINLLFGVYDKSGNLQVGPAALGSLWAGFPVNECTDESGDGVVLYDQAADRWILSQFTTRGINYPNEPLDKFYNCVAVSTTGDPTGSYYRYAFTTGYNFPDYPKYSVWKDSYVITTREFGVQDPNFYGIGVYGLERNKMLVGDPKARAVSFLLDSSVVPINLMGDGLLPADVDGKSKPKQDAKIPIVGTQDDGGPYGATFDALNIWDLDVHWNSTPTASLVLNTQLPVAPFDSIFPCAPTARDCLPQPGITDPAQYLDILSYRQRPTFRLAYRNFGTYEALVTNQSVESAPGVAGVRWYEIRRTGGTYALYQQGTYAPADGVNRWMGSAAMDKKGDIALGYSVVNGTDVFPGIRYTGRLAGDPLGQMTLGEGTIVNGTGVQRSTNSRWGDYTDLTIDPTDDCTFWYVNEYYTAAGQASSTAGWQTRIASFKLPGC
jgi:hypothetical protein